MKSNKVINIIFSLIIGFIGAGATFFLMIVAFIALGLFGWTDGGDPQMIKRLEMTTNITFIISILVSLAVGVLIVYVMNKPKPKDTKPSPVGNL